MAPRTDATTLSQMPHSSSSTSSRCLAHLQPVEVRPERYSQGTAAATALRKIDMVRIERVVERAGTLYYVVDVYLQRPESRIPTNMRRKDSRQQSEQPQQQKQQQHTAAAAKATATQDRAPDFQVERCFSDFAKLRSKAYRVAQNSHSMLRCSFCNDVVNSTLLGANQPKWFMNVVLSRAVLARVLASYLNGLLDMTLRSKRNNGCRSCAGQEQIPQLLRDLLTPASVDDAMRL